MIRFILKPFFLIFILSVSLISFAFSEEPLSTVSPPMAAVLTIDGAIGPATSYIMNSFDKRIR